MIVHCAAAISPHFFECINHPVSKWIHVFSIVPFKAFTVQVASSNVSKSARVRHPRRLHHLWLTSIFWKSAHAATDPFDCDANSETHPYSRVNTSPSFQLELITHGIQRGPSVLSGCTHASQPWHLTWFLFLSDGISWTVWEKKIESSRAGRRWRVFSATEAQVRTPLNSLLGRRQKRTRMSLDGRGGVWFAGRGAFISFVLSFFPQQDNNTPMPWQRSDQLGNLTHRATARSLLWDLFSLCCINSSLSYLYPVGLRACPDSV